MSRATTDALYTAIVHEFRRIATFLRLLAIPSAEALAGRFLALLEETAAGLDFRYLIEIPESPAPQGYEGTFFMVVPGLAQNPDTLERTVAGLEMALRADGKEKAAERVAVLRAEALALGREVRRLLKVVSPNDVWLDQEPTFDPETWTGVTLPHVTGPMGPGARERAVLASSTLMVILGGRSEEALRVAGGVLRAGGRLIQYREKRLPVAERLASARALRDATLGSGGLLIVDDDPLLALLSSADGVHLGQEDVPVAEARKLLGQSPIAGGTVHTRAEWDAVRQAGGCDYVGAGTWYKSRSKPELPVRPRDELLALWKEIDVVAFAIGGVEAHHVPDLRADGVHRVAVGLGIAEAPDSEAATAAFLEKLA